MLEKVLAALVAPDGVRRAPLIHRHCISIVGCIERGLKMLIKEYKAKLTTARL